MTKNSKISICDTYIHPGEEANLALALPEQYSCAPMYMPIKVIHGKKKGPCLVLLSALKGTELNGLEIVNQVMRSLSASDIAGTIIAIPVMNVYGLTHYPATLPSGTNLSNCFPGEEKGSFGERIAYLVTEEILKKADYCIELQTGGMNHNILPQVYCNFQNQQAKELAKVFKSPVITNVSLEKHSLRQTTEELNLPLLVYQGGESMRFDEHAISLGVEGIKNVMRAVDMLEKAPSEDFNPIFSREEEWILCHTSGILYTNVTLGQTIEKGEHIGEVRDPFGSDILEPITAPQKGIVVGVNTAPLVYEGLPLFKVASFLDYNKAETTIEEWDKQQPDSYIG